MCTLDPLGYKSDQYFTVPFLVLQKAYEMELKEKTEAREFVRNLVEKTCSMVLSCNQQFKYRMIKQVRAFIDSASGRTVDVVPSTNLLSLQLYTWSKLRDHQQVINIEGLEEEIASLSLT